MTALQVPAELPRRGPGTGVGPVGTGIDYPGAPRAADVPLPDGRRLYEVLRDGRHVLLAPAGAEPRLRATRGRVTHAFPADPATPWSLLRPYAHVAWRGAPAALHAALDQAGLTG